MAKISIIKNEEQEIYTRKLTSTCLETHNTGLQTFDFRFENCQVSFSREELLEFLRLSNSLLNEEYDDEY